MLSNQNPEERKFKIKLFDILLDYDAQRKEHLDTLANYINRHEKFKGSLDCNLKVLLLEALIKLVQVTLKSNRLEAEFYLHDVVAGTECDKSFQRD